MKKSAMLTSKRTYDRNLQAKINEIRKAENTAASSINDSGVR